MHISFATGCLFASLSSSIAISLEHCIVVYRGQRKEWRVASISTRGRFISLSLCFLENVRLWKRRMRTGRLRFITTPLFLWFMSLVRQITVNLKTMSFSWTPWYFYDSAYRSTSIMCRPSIYSRGHDEDKGTILDVEMKLFIRLNLWLENWRSVYSNTRALIAGNRASVVDQLTSSKVRRHLYTCHWTF